MTYFGRQRRAKWVYKCVGICVRLVIVVYVWKYVHIHTHTHICCWRCWGGVICLCRQRRAKWVYTCVCTCIRMYICIYMRVYVHTHTHIHTHALGAYVTHLIESCHTQERVTSHRKKQGSTRRGMRFSSVLSIIWSHLARMNESCHTYERVSHVTHMNESHHTEKKLRVPWSQYWVTSHMSVSRHTEKNYAQPGVEWVLWMYCSPKNAVIALFSAEVCPVCCKNAFHIMICAGLDFPVRHKSLCKFQSGTNHYVCEFPVRHKSLCTNWTSE